MNLKLKEEARARFLEIVKGTTRLPEEKKLPVIYDLLLSGADFSASKPEQEKITKCVPELGVHYSQHQV